MKRKLIIVTIILLGLKLNLKAQSFTDSVKKYDEISSYLTWNGHNDWLLSYYLRKRNFYISKVDTLKMLSQNKRDSILKHNLEVKYKIKLP